MQPEHLVVEFEPRSCHLDESVEIAIVFACFLDDSQMVFVPELCPAITVNAFSASTFVGVEIVIGLVAIHNSKIANQPRCWSGRQCEGAPFGALSAVEASNTRNNLENHLQSSLDLPGSGCAVVLTNL